MKAQHQIFTLKIHRISFKFLLFNREDAYYYVIFIFLINVDIPVSSMENRYSNTEFSEYIQQRPEWQRMICRFKFK